MDDDDDYDMYDGNTEHDMWVDNDYYENTGEAPFDDDYGYDGQCDDYDGIEDYIDDLIAEHKAARHPVSSKGTKKAKRVAQAVVADRMVRRHYVERQAIPVSRPAKKTLCGNNRTVAQLRSENIVFAACAAIITLLVVVLIMAL